MALYQIQWFPFSAAWAVISGGTVIALYATRVAAENFRSAMKR
jgi:hypothetical protein